MTCHDLSILCVTKGEDCILPLLSRMINQAQSIDAEIVLAVDGQSNCARLKSYFTELSSFRIECVESKGYIESVLDRAVDLTSREYVFRLDDDESIPDELIRWLSEGGYRSHPHWKFNRAHLWRDEKTVITNPPLWPDHQTRLSTRALSYGRTSIHCGSPFGGGELCPHPILHHKFLVKSLAERRWIAQKYEKVSPGAGVSFWLFSAPEDRLLPEEIITYPLPVVEAFSAVQFQMEQIQEEIWPFAEWLWQRKPHNVLEIGVRHGGTSALWHGLCTGIVVGVDWEGRDGLGKDTRLLHGNLMGTYPRFRSIIGDSQLLKTRREIESCLDDGLFDFVFVDGDHSYEGVTIDFSGYASLLVPGGCIAFHDIVDTPTTRNAGQGVFRFWSELKTRYPGQWKEFSTQSEWGGIGALIL